ncbi:unnamed protein product, partial [Coregonus sp. 'balchen']
VKSVINLLFAAYTGDVSALRRFALSSIDMEQKDYYSRTALHVAAVEGTSRSLLLWSSVAQLVEHGACNAKVVGSIPGTTHTQKCMHA